MWETIKQILHKSSSACIIIEEGRPAYVVTRFDEYQKLLDGQPSMRLGQGSNEQELLEKINQEINNWKAQQIETSEEIAETESEDVKIENLPIV